jgi:peptide subunit release factor 1 (eRF1)
MGIPALDFTALDRYSPELRDRVLALLQGSAATGYEILSPDALRELAKLESPDEPVFSLYLQLGPDRRAGSGWRSAFHSLRHATLELVTERRRREAMQETFERIIATLEDALPTLGRGAAFFSCRTLGLWRKVSFALPLPDAVHLEPRPHIRPLVRTADEHDRFLLALQSQNLSRFFLSQIGQLQEVLQVKLPPAPWAGAKHGLHAPMDRRFEPTEEHAARLLAHIIPLVVTEAKAPHLLLWMTPRMHETFIRLLPKEVAQHIAGSFSVELHSGPAEIAAAAEPAQRAVEAQEETATVQRVVDAGPRGSAWGEQATLDALREGRVMTLIVDDALTHPGALCRACTSLWAAQVERCGFCGSTELAVVPDIVELALERALLERCALELVRSEAARRLLAQLGPMAALLR